MRRNSQLFILGLVSVIATAAGCGGKLACTDMSGQGIQCAPVSKVYEQKMLGVAPEESETSKDKKAGAGRVADQPLEADQGAAALRSMVYSENIPVRIPPKVIRIWIAPWEDADGDLHQPEYIFSEINSKRGRWLFGEKEGTGSRSLLRPVETPEQTEVKEEDLKTPPPQPQPQTRPQSKPPVTLPPSYQN